MLCKAKVVVILLVLLLVPFSTNAQQEEEVFYLADESVLETYSMLIPGNWPQVNRSDFTDNKQARLALLELQENLLGVDLDDAFTIAEAVILVAINPDIQQFAQIEVFATDIGAFANMVSLDAGKLTSKNILEATLLNEVATLSMNGRQISIGYLDDGRAAAMGGFFVFQKEGIVASISLSAGIEFFEKNRALALVIVSSLRYPEEEFDEQALLPLLPNGMPDNITIPPAFRYPLQGLCKSAEIFSSGCASA